jgi:hypothetical protein
MMASLSQTGREGETVTGKGREEDTVTGKGRGHGRRGGRRIYIWNED